MKLTVTRKHGAHQIGDTIDATPATSEWLTRHGYAIETKPEPKQESKTEEKPKRTTRKTRKNVEAD